MSLISELLFSMLEKRMEESTSASSSMRSRKRPRPPWTSSPVVRKEREARALPEAAAALLLVMCSLARGAVAATSTSSSSSSRSVSVSSTGSHHSLFPPPAPEAIFSTEQLQVLLEVGDALAALSLVGSAFIVASYAAFRHLRTFAYKLILSLGLANAGFNIATLSSYGAPADSFQCQAQGVATVYFSLVQMALVTAIMGTCYAMVVRRDLGVHSRLAAVTAISWVLPLLMALLPLTTGSYGSTGAWCSIVSTNLKAVVAGTVWRFILLYVPLWVSTAANAYLYWRVWRATQGLRAALRAYDGVEDEDDLDDYGFAVAAGGITVAASSSTATAATAAGSGISAAASTTAAAGGSSGPPLAHSGTRIGIGSGSGSSSSSTARTAVRSIMSGGGSDGSGGGGGGTVGTGSLRSGETTLQIINRLRMYPMALIICWSWSSVNRIYEVFEPYNAQYWLVVLQYTFQFMQGVCNAIIFGLTPTVLSSWHILLKDAGGRCCRSCRKPAPGRSASPAAGTAAAAAAAVAVTGTTPATAVGAPRSPSQPFWRRFGSRRAGKAVSDGQESLLPVSLSIAGRANKEP